MDTRAREANIMTSQIQLLAATAASIGFLHTLAGPDHYLPFIMMARAGNWNRKKTLLITFLSGIGHVFSSVILGFVGIGLGVVVAKLEIIESFRGDLAAWLFTTFGFVYLVWGIWKAIKNRPHTHPHIHEGGAAHIHNHRHEDEHVHVHEAKKANLTPWIIFTIFVFGPCEPLIPILMYPAAHESVSGLLIVTTIFAAATIGTMLAVVTTATFGLNLLPFGRLERYTHAIAGGTIMVCGLAITFLGL